MAASSLGQLPRNREQVKNIRRKVNSQVPLCSRKSIRDPLFMVMEQSKLSGDKFVRVVTASPEPMCILATDNQLDDLVRFATNPTLFSILSVDPTFCLGDFSVTCIAYRHLLVVDRSTSQSPTMLGPVLVHQKKSFETYHFFASSLIGMRPSLDNILAFGTDGEQALVNAFQKQFRFATHLRCFRHLKQNITRKLTVDMGLSSETSTKVIRDIFGCRLGPTFYEGLVDAISEAQFNEKLSLLEEEWRSISKPGDVPFFEWFKRYHADVVKSTMLRPVRELAGLGNPPMEYCTNDSESINSAVKQFVNFKKSDWPVFNENMKKFVETQQNEVQKTIVGIGQYILRDDYQYLKVASNTWFSLSECQRKDYIDKFQHANVDDKVCSKGDTMLTMGLPDPKLSVSIEVASSSSGLPALLLKSLWNKSYELLCDGKGLL